MKNNLLRYSHILPESHVDGPGRRAVLFVQGCTLECPGCQNHRLWDGQGGQVAHPVRLAEELLTANPEAVTISGGEPFQQPEALAELLLALRLFAPDVHVIVFTGYEWGELFAQVEGRTLAAALHSIDVLVVGRFVRQLDNPTLQYRGSANQIPIDVAATLSQRPAAAPPPVALDWDTPEVVISSQGDLFIPLGRAAELAEIGQGQTTRRCGQTTRSI